jgi:trehalose-6-phosphatase
MEDIPEGTPVAFLGDDQTDEDAFEMLGERGLKVLVRPEFRDTKADLWLVPPKELLTFLDDWHRARR